MDLLQAVFLGALQGLTEWLPVSSSAHLALAQIFLGLKVPIAFDLALHLGTLLAVFAYFWKDIIGIARGFFSFDWMNAGFRTAVLVVLAMVPTAVTGFAFKGFFESMFSSAFLIGLALMLTGTFLFLASQAVNKNREIGATESVAIGVAQGIAVAPGISRSGSTISAAMLLGVPAEKAARFSFLLGIPAILGASAFEIAGEQVELAAIPAFSLIAGIAAAALAGYWSIGYLLGILRTAGLRRFAYYCWAVGLLAAAASVFVLGKAF
ncbi:MAG: undecaprenyl-diphosphate phosphatase [Candidatus Micrarchaeota archaeon]